MVVHAYYPRGETRVQRQAAALVEAGYEVDVLCLRDADEPATETVDGVRVTRLPVRRSRGGSTPVLLVEYLLFFVLVACRLPFMQRARRYRTIQVHNLPDFLIFSAAIPRMMGARLILDLHDLMPELFAARRRRTMKSLEVRALLVQERLACRFADHVITVTDRWRDTLLGRSASPEKVSVVMNLADPSLFRPNAQAPHCESTEFHVLYHGTFTHRYGVDVLIRAAAAAFEDMPGLRVRMLGDGEMRRELLDLTSALGLGEIVEFSDGMVAAEQLPDAIAWADVGVVPNRNNIFTDGILPTKLLELVATETPAIVARSHAVMEYFSDDMVHYVEPGDVESLTTALHELAEAPGPRAALARRAARFNEEHSWTEAAEEYAALVTGVGSPQALTGEDAHDWVVDDGPVDAEWDDFVARVPGGDLVQTSLWARVKGALGWRVVRVIAYRADAIVGGAQLLIRPLSRLGAVGYVPRGPVVAEDADLEHRVLEQLLVVARQRRVRHLTVQPMHGSQLSDATLAALGFDPEGEAVTPAATSYVDLSPEPDEILAGMSRRTRYNVRLSGRKGVTTEVGTADDVDQFYDFVEQTAARRNFTPFPRSYYHNLWSVLDDGGHVGLSFAVVDGRRVAAQLVTGFGDTMVNRLSVWSGEGGDAKPNEAIQWATIQRARASGYRRYDLEGINHSAARALQAGQDLPDKYLNSTTSFKLGFGGEVVVFPRPRTYVHGRVNRFAYRMFLRSRRGRKMAKQLRKAVRAGDRLRIRGGPS
jgi:lipid II:glycine glycyltransferase (peptidoglycan interpeptide bridge formation enzyme)/glycosyltransferase involved in cell wall biosynthesis